MSNQVTITPVTPAGPALVLELVSDDALTGGVGGWESLPRARRSPAAGWVGLPDTTYVLPVMLDGTRDDGSAMSVEAKVRQVEGWAAPTSATREPPVLAIAGRQLLAPPAARWVLQDLVRDGHQRDDDGARVQQLLTLTFLLYLEPRLVASPAKRRRNRKGKKKDDGKGSGKKKTGGKGGKK